MGSKVDQDAVAKRINPCSCRESNPGPSAHSLVPILLNRETASKWVLTLYLKQRYAVSLEPKRGDKVFSSFYSGTWTVILREEHRMLSKVFGPEREEVAGG
jgi:hypothetical protein